MSSEFRFKTDAGHNSGRSTCKRPVALTRNNYFFKCENRFFFYLNVLTKKSNNCKATIVLPNNHHFLGAFLMP